MEIFTGAITNWDDKHHQGLRRPAAEPAHHPGDQVGRVRCDVLLHPVDGARVPSQWNAFCKKVKPGVSLPCGQTEFYPLFRGAKSENGSNNVATYITASYGNGAIGYDEYAYALNSHYPVVKLLNPAGYYVLPTASNVAVALTKAVINEDTASPDFLQQDLDSVYTFTDPRSYPLSSYSYLIVPRAGTHEPTNFTPAKGKTLSTFVDYFLCAGQKEVAALGYSPLPLNLVQGGLLQNSKIPGAVAGPNPTTLAGCANPTFTNGKLTLLITAPQPSPCDKVGEPLNCVVVNGKATTPGSGSGSASPGASSPTAGGVPSAGPAPSASSGPVAVTGQVVNVAATTPNKLMLSVLTAVAIILAVMVPPALGGWLRRRRRQEPG
jgi:ABC-type phosphate transport system substrate-binding protein